MAEFDFDFQPSIDRKLAAELSTLRFIPERRNLLLLGPPGGKTHLAIALGVTATEAGYQAYFTSAADMVQNLQAAHLAGNASYTMRLYLRPTVLVIDELGYLPMNQDAANRIFQVVSRRYEKGAPIILTSNRGFSDWGQIFADQVVAAAIVDRLLHNAVVLNIRGLTRTWWAPRGADDNGEETTMLEPPMPPSQLWGEADPAASDTTHPSPVPGADGSGDGSNLARSPRTCPHHGGSAATAELRPGACAADMPSRPRRTLAARNPRM